VRGRILLYHHIAEAPTKEAAKTTLFVHPEHFAFQMALLKRLFAVLPLDEFVARLRSRRLPPKAIALTFDDGTVDFVENALPALVGECLPATLFVVAGKLGQKMDWLNRCGIPPIPLLSAETLRDLPSLIDLGSHSLTHRRLSSLTEAELCAEVTESKGMLEQLVGRPVRWFAYPFGETSEAMQAKVQEAGYEAAFTTQRGWATSANSLWALPRLAVPYWVGRVGFFAMAAFCSQLAEAEETMSALLVLTLHHIGDVLFTEPAIAALKAGHPEKPLLVVTSQEGEAVLKGHPAIDQLWVRVRTVRGFGRLLRWLRQHRATAAVSFSPSSLGLALATLLSGAKRRFGFTFRFHVSIFFTDKLPMQPQRHVVDDYLALAKAAGGKKERRIPRLFLRPEEEAWGREWLRAQGWDETTPLLGCHPFSSVASKEWGLTNFAILLQWVWKELGWLPIVFGSLGGAGESGKVGGGREGSCGSGQTEFAPVHRGRKMVHGFYWRR